MSKKSVSSTFDKNADGWTMYNDAQSYGYKSSGGNPGGYFGWTDKATGEAAYYIAPAKFLGNDKGYYGGTLSYDVVDFKGNNITSADPDLVLSDGQHVLLGLNPNAVGTSWTHETFALNESDLYWYSSGSISQATKAEVKEVLANLQIAYIRAEFWDGKETGGLDNVILSKGKSDVTPNGAAPTHFDPAILTGTHHLVDALHPVSPAQSLDHAHLAIA